MEKNLVYIHGDDLLLRGRSCWLECRWISFLTIPLIPCHISPNPRKGSRSGKARKTRFAIGQQLRYSKKVNDEKKKKREGKKKGKEKKK